MLPAVQDQRHTPLFSSCPQYCSAGKCRGIPALQPCKRAALMCSISSPKIISSKISLSKWEYLFREAKIHHSMRREPGKSTFIVLISCWNPQGLLFPVPSSGLGPIIFSSAVKDWFLVLYFSMHLFPFPTDVFSARQKQSPFYLI